MDRRVGSVRWKGGRGKSWLFIVERVYCFSCTLRKTWKLIAIWLILVVYKHILMNPTISYLQEGISGKCETTYHVKETRTKDNIRVFNITKTRDLTNCTDVPYHMVKTNDLKTKDCKECDKELVSSQVTFFKLRWNWHGSGVIHAWIPCFLFNQDHTRFNCFIFFTYLGALEHVSFY